MAVLASPAAVQATTQAVDHVGFTLDVFTDTAEMLLSCGAHPPACAVIDSLADQIDVPAVVAALVGRASIPVLVGVWDDETSRRIAVDALQAGGRGLIGFPVSAADLEGALRTSGGRANAGFTKVEVGSVTLFKESREVWIRDVELRLAEIEFGVLWCLLRSFPQPVPMAELTNGCGEFAPCKPAALKARVSRLRHKFDEAVPGAGAVLMAVPRVGYAAREFY